MAWLPRKNLLRSVSVNEALNKRLGPLLKESLFGTLFCPAEYICPHCGSFESRRPSSVPVSSPWHHGQRPSSAAGHNESRPSTPLKKAAEPQPSRSRGIATNGGRAADTSADSPPPASPLGGAHESDDDQTGPIEGRAGDYKIGQETETGGAQLRRSARKASGMEVD